ncbi:protein NDNF [Culicoides brevitarsis]|uniref:protein NDNF n=1 Tax=Culicoides brevitarsis TaxID=469753 RepID=UPI00307BD04E
MMAIKKLLIVTVMILTTSVDRQMIKNVWGQLPQATQQKQCTYGLNTVQNIIGDQIPTIVLYENVPIKEYIDKGQRKRFSIPLPESSPITITVTPTAEITWRVVFNNTLTLASYNVTDDKTLSLSCASAGEYDIFIIALARTHIRVSYTLTYDQAPYWPYMNWTSPAKIRFQYQPKRLQLLLKWEKSKVAVHEIQYCVSINVHKPQQSLCQALGSASKSTCGKFNLNNMLQSTRYDLVRKIDTSRMNVICTGYRTQQMLRGMRLQTMYYVDVFAIHTGLNNFTYLYGSDVVWFNRTRPMQLVEGKTSVGKLSILGGMSVFSFKVPMRSSTNNFQLFLTPCSSMVDVKIIKDKKIVKSINNIFKPQVIRMNGTRPGERYVIRVIDADENPWGNKVELSVTTKKRFQNFPTPPKSLEVKEVQEYKTCNSTVIAWNSSLDIRDVKYRIFVIREYQEDRYLDNIKLTNYCIVNSKITSHPQFHKVYCIPGKKSELQNFTITGLSPGGLYIIYVTASLGNGKSFSYQLLKIRTNASCANGGGRGSNSSLNISSKYAKYNLMKYEIFGKNWSPSDFSNDLKN